MRLRQSLLAAALFVFVLPMAGPAAAAEKCAPDTLADTLHARMKTEGKSDDDIRDILGSGMKRRVLRGRVADGSGCTSDQTEAALGVLETRLKAG